LDTLNKIIEKLKQCGKTQKNLTDFLGLEKGIFSAWKAGRSNSYLKYISQISEFLEVSTDYLLGNEQKEKSPLSKESELAEILSLLNDKGAAKVLEYAKLLRLQQEHQEQVDK